MKTLNKFLLLAFVAVFSFSCGKDDPTPTEKSGTLTYTWTIPIQGIADQVQTTPAKTIALADVMGETDAKNFTSGTFQRIAGNSIELTSSKAVPIKEITLKVGSDSYSITDFNDTAGEGVLNFLNKVFNAYTGKSKSTTVTATFTPTASILDNDVNLKISIKALYKWNTYDK